MAPSGPLCMKEPGAGICSKVRVLVAPTLVTQNHRQHFNKP